ncbi:MAG: hypothetical protein JXR37_09190 [Kiritimatiellae bacterium]|nr:hypothetical protein [Kiritimatiellia bacterium]
MKLHREKAYPYLVGLVVSALGISLFNYSGATFPKTICDLLAAAINVSAISMGFLATAKSIIYSMEDRRIMRIVKDADYHVILIDYFMTAIRWSLALAIWSGVGLVIEWQAGSTWQRVFAAIWLMIVTTMGFACYRIMHIFAKLLRHPD